MKQFWYFGIRVKKSIANAAGFRQQEVAIWAPRVYENAAAAAQAAAAAMQSRPGVSFFVQCFDRELNIQPDGTCTGFKEAQ